LSTITGWPRIFTMGSAAVRATMSLAPPGGNVAIRVIGLAG
jgi:hypothetical protein